MKKYYVIATVWSDEKKAQVKKIQGEFDNYTNAKLFEEAYNFHYKSDAIVIDEYALITKSFTHTI